MVLNRGGNDLCKSMSPHSNYYYVSGINSDLNSNYQFRISIQIAALNLII